MSACITVCLAYDTEQYSTFVLWCEAKWPDPVKVTSTPLTTTFSKSRAFVFWSTSCDRSDYEKIMFFAIENLKSISINVPFQANHWSRPPKVTAIDQPSYFKATQCLNWLCYVGSVVNGQLFLCLKQPYSLEDKYINITLKLPGHNNDVHDKKEQAGSLSIRMIKQNMNIFLNILELCKWSLIAIQQCCWRSL